MRAWLSIYSKLDISLESTRWTPTRKNQNDRLSYRCFCNSSDVRSTRNESLQRPSIPLCWPDLPTLPERDRYATDPQMLRRLFARKPHQLPGSPYSLAFIRAAKVTKGSVTEELNHLRHDADTRRYLACLPTRDLPCANPGQLSHLSLRELEIHPPLLQVLA